MKLTAHASNLIGCDAFFEPLHEQILATLVRASKVLRDYSQYAELRKSLTTRSIADFLGISAKRLCSIYADLATSCNYVALQVIQLVNNLDCLEEFAKCLIEKGIYAPLVPVVKRFVIGISEPGTGYPKDVPDALRVSSMRMWRTLIELDKTDESIRHLGLHSMLPCVGEWSVVPGASDQCGKWL